MRDPASSQDVLFPDYLHLFLFCSYIGLFVNQGILVTASKNADGSYAYNTTTVVLLTECVKLVIACLLYLREFPSPKRLLGEVVGNGRICALYLIPAFLYCLYNNLGFVNLQYYDPTSYFLLLNFRTVATGVIFQVIFKKKLSRQQWVALVILTLGCVVKQVHFDELQNVHIKLDFHLVLLLVQVFCSCFAGVYSEFLLKDAGVEVHIHVQNTFMYLNSILMNLGFLALRQSLFSAFTAEALKSVMKPGVLAIVLNNGIAGITTSIFLKKFNSILKTFAGGIELLLTAVLAWLLFGIRIDGFMAVSIALVSYAMYLYAREPVINPPKRVHAVTKPPDVEASRQTEDI